jgi:hypothetical protein
LQQEDFQTALRTHGEIEATQENIQGWLELDEGYPGEGEIVAVIFFVYFHQHYLYYQVFHLFVF